MNATVRKRTPRRSRPRLSASRAFDELVAADSSLIATPKTNGQKKERADASTLSRCRPKASTTIEIEL